VFCDGCGFRKKIGEYLPNTVNGQVLRFSDSAKDLGVLLDSSLSFFPHIADIVVKARQRVLLLSKVFTTRSCTHLIRAYKTFIIPILEFNSQIWSPCKVGDISLLKSVQRLFSRRLIGSDTLAYKDGLIKLNLMTLERRRLIADLILYYKLIMGLIPDDLSLFGLELNTRDSRGHNYKIPHQLINCNAYKCALSKE